jgi:phospho-N-acetylmuramoyl-pentapeptide-transferase
MLYLLFQKHLDLLLALGYIFSFAGTALCLCLLRNRLPQDQGRAFAVNGEKSKGKARGAGIIMIAVLAISVLLFIPSENLEYPLYCLFLVAAMLTGFFDDASKKPWNEYLKGALDLAIAFGLAFTFCFYNGSDIHFLLLSTVVTVPKWLFIILAIILIWASINVVNCTDGVDGLCASLSIVTILGFFMLNLKTGIADAVNPMAISFVMMLLAYLLFNSSPSTILMGDAGSRPLGLFIALLALKNDPILFLPFALVFILDGGLGLIKVSLLRFLKISIMKNIRTPLHDHFRKNKGWSDTQTVFRFTVVQAALIIVVLSLIR